MLPKLYTEIIKEPISFENTAWWYVKQGVVFYEESWYTLITLAL